MTPPLAPDTRKSLLFALTAERLSAYYEHGQWLTEAQGATLAGLWLSRSQQTMDLATRRHLSDLSDRLARQIAAGLSREAGLYTAHEMNEGLDPRYQSSLVMQMMDECGRLLLEAAEE